MKKFLIIIASFLIITVFSIAKEKEYKIDFPPVKKLSMAEMAVETYYVDSVDGNKLVEDAIRGMLNELDPHSSYSTPEETKEMNEPLEGNFSGIGITFNFTQDTVYVIQTVAGGPSEKVGLLAGDRIIKVSDTIIAGVKMKQKEIMRRLRGEKGTKVDVKVLRRQTNAVTDTIDFTITRDEIPIHSVDAAYMVDDKTAYIKINKFALETANEFIDAYKKLKKKGAENLILDLTDNGGGYLGSAVQLVSEFLEDSKLIVYTEGRASKRQEFTSLPSEYTPLHDTGRLVVMVNQYSASAAEITAGAIQDWDRGVIVGRRTFAKGLVQRPLPFPDGSMIRLTVAHYYTPTGRDIQKPYQKGDIKKYNQDIMDRFNNGELMHADSIHYVDSLKVSTLVNKRTIYGGGGISPDKFVALDTTFNTKYYRNVVAKGLVNRFAINYVDDNRKQLKKQFSNEEKYLAGFEISDEILNQLKELADKEKVEFDQEQFNTSKPLFAVILKALIGRSVYNDETYYKVFNTFDPIFKEAYNVITSDEYDNLLKAGEIN